MEKLKNFWDKHKVKICVIGGAIIVGTVSYLITKDFKHWINLKGKQAIIWPNSNGDFMNIEKVKEVLEANKDNTSKFAIFREGPDPTKYITIIFDDEVVIP